VPAPQSRARQRSAFAHSRMHACTYRVEARSFDRQLAQGGPVGEKANRFAETTDFQPRSPPNRPAAPSLHGTRIDLSAFVSERKPAFFPPLSPSFFFIIFFPPLPPPPRPSAPLPLSFFPPFSLSLFFFLSFSFFFPRSQ